MGETELVLDRMTVDEAMRLLGGGGTSPGNAATAVASSARSAPSAPADPSDWRAILRAGEAVDEARASGPVDRWAGGPEKPTPTEDTSFVAPAVKSPEPPPAPIV